MSEIISALGLVMVLEGALYALFPDAMRRMAAQIALLPGSQLRAMGLLLAGLGFAIVAAIKSGP